VFPFSHAQAKTRENIVSASPRSVATERRPAGLLTTIIDLSEYTTSGSGIVVLYLPTVSLPSDLESTVIVVPGEIFLFPLFTLTQSAITRPWSTILRKEFFFASGCNNDNISITVASSSTVIFGSVMALGNRSNHSSFLIDVIFKGKVYTLTVII
jgi:hypothetical protein